MYRKAYLFIIILKSFKTPTGFKTVLLCSLHYSNVMFSCSQTSDIHTCTVELLSLKYAFIMYSKSSKKGKLLIVENNQKA